MADHSNPDEKHSHTSEPARAVSRRRLLKKAGWTVPVVIAVTVPMDAHAQMSSAETSTSERGLPGNRSDPWPEDGLTVAGAVYSGRQLLLLLKDDDHNVTRRLVRQIIIAKANSARGGQVPHTVHKVIQMAEERLSTYGPLYPDPPRPKSREDRKLFISWARVLEEYNTGHGSHRFCP